MFLIFVSPAKVTKNIARVRNCSDITICTGHRLVIASVMALVMGLAIELVMGLAMGMVIGSVVESVMWLIMWLVMWSVVWSVRGPVMVSVIRSDIVLVMRFVSKCLNAI